MSPASRPRTEARTANPINPTGIPRGIAKERVYCEIARLYREGPHKLDVIACLRRSPKPPREDELFARVTDDPWATRPPNHLEIAWILLAEAGREYVASRESGASIAADANDNPSTVAVLDWTSREKEAEWRQLVFEWLWRSLRLGVASAEEAAAARDLQVLRRIAQADQPEGRFRTAAEAWAHAENEFRQVVGREPAPVPGAVEDLAERIVRKRRRQAAHEASAFRRELGKLPEQNPEQQRATIADWVRMARKAGIVPPRPARPKGSAAGRTPADRRRI